MIAKLLIVGRRYITCWIMGNNNAHGTVSAAAYSDADI